MSLRAHHQARTPKRSGPGGAGSALVHADERDHAAHPCTVAASQRRPVKSTIATSAALFPTAEITGDVVVGERTIIGAGVKIIGDSHGPVRIGNDVQILENTVLHLLPDNDLIIDDGAIVGPGAMIHGCRIGARSVVEPGAIVCDGSVVGAGCVVRAGAVVKQRSRLAAGTDIDGFPAVEVGRIPEAPQTPDWALRHDDLPIPAHPGPSQ